MSCTPSLLNEVQVYICNFLSGQNLFNFSWLHFIKCHFNPSANIVGPTFKIDPESKLILLPSWLSPWTSQHHLALDCWHGAMDFYSSRLPVGDSLHLCSKPSNSFPSPSPSCGYTSPPAFLRAPSTLIAFFTLFQPHQSPHCYQAQKARFHFRVSVLILFY